MKTYRAAAAERKCRCSQCIDVYKQLRPERNYRSVSQNVRKHGDGVTPACIFNSSTVEDGSTWVNDYASLAFAWKCCMIQAIYSAVCVAA
jgi:hypothetical protein